ncbi:primosomal protein N' [Moraxella cuniculi]|nr:primosomal protein N' [Moraxella cuniculi]OOS06431.1 primosomal protein N' [Moraxella cuniculi]
MSKSTSSTPMHDSLIQVALNVPVGDLFDYLCPAELPLPPLGVRVQVPFGTRQLIGIVANHNPQAMSQVPKNKLKTITKILDDTPIIDEPLQRLATWLADYYHHRLGDVYAVMLPSLINQGKPITTHLPYYHATTNDLTQLSKTAKKQRQIFTHIINHPDGVSEPELYAIGATRKILLSLIEKGLISQSKQSPSDKPVITAQLKSLELSTNAEQAAALRAIHTAIDKGAYQGFLLDGVTGSGKTEVYLQAMHRVLTAGKQALILVPEIGLTPQTQARFGSRFDANICVLHSGMNDTQRLQGWQACRTGTAQIIIGTRSSILYPFANLGLIIIDEAHDNSYKQQDHLRYHACDVAMVRALFAQIPIILGTATPSLEQLKLVHDHKLHHLTLTKRAGNATAAAMHLVDIRQGEFFAPSADGQPRPTSLAPATVQKMHACLSRGEQVLVFLNRRGYAPILLCQSCGYQADCPHCDAHLTVHKNSSQAHASLHCHHCGYRILAPEHCPECNSRNLTNIGTGTTRLAEELHALFANPQTTRTPYPIIQIDRDTMRKKDAWENAMQQIHTQGASILVGTQMIAKGHHFENVTLVVIVNADLGFLSPDFRSPEHTAQRIIQVAGRAGRASKAGEVLIQTLRPDNPLLTTLIKQGYHALAYQLLDDRRRLNLPPYSHAALVRADSHRYQHAKTAIIAAKNALPTQHSFIVNAPIDAPMTKKNNRYVVQLLILAKNRRLLHELLNHWWPAVLQLPSSKAVRLTIDIDPVGW